MDIEFNFLDFENPNSIIAITTPSEICPLTSIFFLIILSWIDGESHIYSWKRDSVQSTTLYFTRFCGHYRLPQAAGDHSGRVQQPPVWPGSRSLPSAGPRAEAGISLSQMLSESQCGSPCPLPPRSQAGSRSNWTARVHFRTTVQFSLKSLEHPSSPQSLCASRGTPGKRKTHKLKKIY